jgi:hypothetical protein
MTTNLYDVNDLVTLDLAVAVADVATDPTTVVCRVKAPDGTVTTPTPIKDATGAYHVDVDATQHGTYRYRWEGTGAAQGAEEGRFDVRRSGVV